MKTLILLVLQTALLLTISQNLHVAAAEDETQKRTYIVHMDKSSKPAAFDDHFNWYESSLKAVSESANMFYTYNHAIHGFATRLSEKEAELLKRRPGVLSVIPEMRYEAQTTRTPEFLGLENTAPFLPGSKILSDLVIGVLDTGVWPESPSYHDKGLGPIPRSWKGECEVGRNFNSSSCNRKLIGARFFYKGYEHALGHPIDEKSESKSPRDDDGHGTHTSSTAAGSAVSGANFLGYAYGTARGIAHTARVATYKILWKGGSFGSDILAAIDKAIDDGVHILSLSLGPKSGGSPDYFEDTIAIPAFAATERGILVSAAAGNAGPREASVSNVAPWFITVGAGTIDRDFPAYLKLGNGKSFKGDSGLYVGKPITDKLVPIVYGSSKNSTDSLYCLPGSLIPKEVSGKIVICNLGENLNPEKSLVVKEAGGVGTILINYKVFSHGDGNTDAHFLPTVTVSREQGVKIKAYLESVANPTATIIQKGMKLGVQPSPRVAAFSSRGPNGVTLELLKPDVIAPGVNILAAWTGAVGPTKLGADKKRVDFNIISGTSMACPHVSGLAALIKSVHPKWSPAAIRSALMTTAYSTYKNGETIQDAVTASPATPFDYGAGHVDPVAALHPGLVYDASVEDYIRFLCASNYTRKQIKTVTRRDFDCNKGKRKYSFGDLNYPSFSVAFDAASDEDGGDDKITTITYTRTVTNVGSSPATYKVSVSKVELVKISVKPLTLTFTKPYEKRTYAVTFTAGSMPWSTTEFARLEWSDGKHVVGSPIAFSWF